MHVICDCPLPLLGSHAVRHTQTTYQYIPFKNEARTDGLELRHWVECYRDAAVQIGPCEEGPYVFAKYNVPSGGMRSDDVEYEQVIRPRFPEAESGWSKVSTARHLVRKLVVQHGARAVRCKR